MKEELKGELIKEMKSDQIIYDVYKTAEGLYVAEEICQMYNVGDPTNYKTLREKFCYKIKEEDLTSIEKQSKYQDIKLVPNIVTIFDLQLVLSFTVYVDKKHNDKLYILNNLCTKYEIYPQSKRIIKGTTYGNITEEDLVKIEEATKREKISLKRKYIDIYLEDEIKPAEYLFIYYFDYETRKSYIRRDMFELFTKSGIEVEGNPKIINGKNCYSITEKQLKNVEQQIGYRGVEQLLKTRPFIDFHKKEPVQESTTTPVIEVPTAPVVTETKEKESTPIESQTKEVTFSTEIEKIDTPTENYSQEKVLIYKNKRNGQLYVPTSLIDSDAEIITIMHRPCYEINIYELNKLYGKKIIIADIFPIEKTEYNVLICNNNGQFYISKDMLEELGFYIENPHRIMVNKQIYEEITEDDIELIKDKESDNRHINIEVKQIVPKRG